MTNATVAPDAAQKKVKQTAEEKAAAKAQKDADKAAAKAAKDAAKPAKPVPKAKDEKNGVTRPSYGVTLQVWTIADQLSAKAGAPIERAPLVDALKGQIEVGTIHTQYGRWRKYYGLTETKEQRQARLTKVRDEKTAKKAAEKAIKDAAKAEKLAAKAEADRVKAAEKAAAEAAKAKACRHGEQAQQEAAETAASE